jgi:deoxycytidylate deaminase
LSKCKRDKCGSVIVLDGKIVGRGHNGPAGIRQYCGLEPTISSKPKSDRTCCVHAEWRAIFEALRSGERLDGGILCFTRVNQNGDILFSGEPYCTVCSRLALEAGIGFFALWQKEGIRVWRTEDYNNASYDFHLKNTR